MNNDWLNCTKHHAGIAAMRPKMTVPETGFEDLNMIANAALQWPPS